MREVLGFSACVCVGVTYRIWGICTEQASVSSRNQTKAHPKFLLLLFSGGSANLSLHLNSKLCVDTELR